MSVERAGVGLALLADLIAAKKLRPQIAVEALGAKIGTVARRLIDREFTRSALGWATPEGRADWLVPHPAVAALVPVLKARHYFTN
jgi:hypothetical protein